MDLPGKPESCWNASVPQTRYPALTRSGRVDVAVIGGGVVGLTTAYLLMRAGHNVAVLEGRRIGREVRYRDGVHTFGVTRLQFPTR